MKTIKSIDGKSMLIGCLLACIFFFATGAQDAGAKPEAEPKKNKAKPVNKLDMPAADGWDTEQQWDWQVIPAILYQRKTNVGKKKEWWNRGKGWELFAVQGEDLVFRRLVKE